MQDTDKRELIKDWVLGVALFVTALALRIPYLWIIPRHIDELKEVKVAFDIYRGVSLPLHNAAWDIGAMHNYILSFIFWMFGPSTDAPRLYVAIVSALTVVAVYFLGKKMFGFWVGLLTAGLLLTSGMHIMVSHMAWANCTTPFFFVLAMLALLAAERRKDGKWLIASAFLWALTLQTHSSVVIYILVAFVYATGPHFREAMGSIRWYYGAAMAFAVGYANMIYFNLIQEPFGSLFFIAKKSYALETKPGLMSFLENANQMLIEMLRTISATYQSHAHFWQYLQHPLFTLSTIVLVIGIYYAFERKYSLPFWMIVGSLAIMPWINQRYVFFLATRYIIPVVICALLLVSLAVVEMSAAAQKKFNRRPVYAVTGVIMALFVFWQVIPFYEYCEKLAGTNLTNEISRQIISTINTQYNNQTTVYVDAHLPIENSPMPYLLELDGKKYQVIGKLGGDLKPAEIKEWHQALKAANGRDTIAILANRSYLTLKDSVKNNKIQVFSCRVVDKGKTSTRRVYLVQVHGILTNIH